MTSSTLIQQISDRTEQLLTRLHELQCSNDLLTEQLHKTTQDRDRLKTRLDQVRRRVDDLVARLPQDSGERAHEERRDGPT